MTTNEHQELARRRRTNKTIEARARAQCAKLDAQTDVRVPPASTDAPSTRGKKTKEHQRMLSNRRAPTTLERAIEDYLLDHEGGNHSKKTIEWHTTALGLLRTFLEQERHITLVGEVDASDITAWFSSLRKTPGDMVNSGVSGPYKHMHARHEHSFIG